MRYIHLDVSLCALVKWNPDGSSWRRFSNSAYRAGYRKIVDVAAQVPRDSPTGKILRELDPGPERFFQGTTVASQWFPFIQQGTHLDVFTTEHAVPLGEYGALTIVIPEAGDGDLQPARWR